MLALALALALPLLSPPASAPTAPKGATVYVSATRLHVRAAPSPRAASLVRLPVNAPLRVLEAGEEWLQVKLGDGREGFVAASMTAASPLTLAAALERAKGAPAERVMWLERAAALSPSRHVLEQLAVALRESGDTARAALLEQRTSWPEDILLVARAEATSAIVEVAAMDAPEERALTAAEQKERGVEVGDAWWVLPARGPAVRATVRAVRVAVWNECGGTSGVEAVLAFERSLAAGDTAVAATRREAPPASWASALPALDAARAKALVRGALAKVKGAPATADIEVANDPDGVVYARAWWTPPGQDDKEWHEVQTRVLSLRLAKGATDAKGTALLDDALGSFTSPPFIVTRRDVDGDGAYDIVASDTCERSVLLSGPKPGVIDDTSVVRARTENRCCGC